MNPYRIAPSSNLDERKASWHFLTKLKRKALVHWYGTWRSRFVRVYCPCGWRDIEERNDGLYYRPGKLIFHQLKHLNPNGKLSWEYVTE